MIGGNLPGARDRPIRYKTIGGNDDGSSAELIHYPYSID